MKKIMNIEVRLICLDTNDILTSSPNNAPRFGSETIYSADAIGISARGYYEDEDEDY